MPIPGPMELAIIAVVLLVLFGGAKLAGLGKSTGRALREFKEETRGLNEKPKTEAEEAAEATPEVSKPAAQARVSDPVEAEIVDAQPRVDR